MNISNIYAIVDVLLQTYSPIISKIKNRNYLYEVGEVFMLPYKLVGNIGKNISNILYLILLYEIITFRWLIPVYFFILYCSNSNTSYDKKEVKLIDNM